MNSHQKRILRRLLERKHANGYAAGVAAERTRVRLEFSLAIGLCSSESAVAHLSNMRDVIVPEPTP